jgi:predicted signal transduction protein with EAL and GGDEF domain
MEALDADTLIARADNAMYASKHLGDHGVTLFADADLEGRSDARSTVSRPSHHG